MAKLITVEIEIEEDEWLEFKERNELEDDSELFDWLCGEIAQNQGLGHIVSYSITPLED